MDLQTELRELEASARRVSDGVSAVQMMVLGLEGAGSEYTGALHAVWSYLSDAEQEFQTQLAVCLRVV